MNVIVAVDENWAIGKGGDQLVYIPEDLKHFKELTMGHPVILGRRTLATFPGGRPLKGRRNLILSRDPDFRPEGGEVYPDVDALLFAAPEDAFVVGGASVYRALLDRCGEDLPQRFSSPLRAKALSLLRQQYEEGLTVQLGALGDRLTAQEMSHLTAVAQKGDVLVNEQALDDYLSVIDEEYEKAHVADTEDLLAMGQRLRRKKGFGGTEQ